MKNYLEFLGLKRRLELKGLKAEEKAKIYNDFKIILKLPRGLSNYDELDDYQAFYNRCKGLTKQNRQLVYYGQLFHLSTKLYFMVCVILLDGIIYEDDFNTLDFRPKKCKVAGQKAERNLEKSIADLKKVLRDRFQKKDLTEINPFNNNVNQLFDRKKFDTAFKQFIHLEQSSAVQTACSLYHKTEQLPTIFERVCKNKSKK